MDKERLASYDRAITAEPSFSSEQAPGLKRDLTDYLATLRVSRSPCFTMPPSLHLRGIAT